MHIASCGKISLFFNGDRLYSRQHYVHFKIVSHELWGRKKNELHQIVHLGILLVGGKKEKKFTGMERIFSNIL